MRVFILSMLSLSLLCVLPIQAETYRYRESGDRLYYYDSQASALTNTTSGKQERTVSKSRVLVRVVEKPDGHYFFALNRLSTPVALTFHFRHNGKLAIPPSLKGTIIIPSASETMVGKLKFTANYRYGFAYQPQTAQRQNNINILAGTTRPINHAHLSYFTGADTPDLASPVRGRYLISQGFNSNFSHNKLANRYALDIALPVGTPLYATKDGVVEAAVDHHIGGGLAPEYRGKANFLRLRHADGTMTLYAHLETSSLLVRLGEQVKQGQPVAASGNTGYSSGPHLHIALQVDREGSRESIPFTLQGNQPLAGSWLSHPHLGIGAQD